MQLVIAMKTKYFYDNNYCYYIDQYWIRYKYIHKYMCKRIYRENIIYINIRVCCKSIHIIYYNNDEIKKTNRKKKLQTQTGGYYS